MVRAALFVVALTFALACRTLPPTQVLAPGDPRPAALLVRMFEQQELRRSLRGRARLVVDSEAGDLRVRAKQIVVVERPARLRVEVLGLLNQTAAVIATDGDRFDVFRADDGSFESGPVDDDLLWREARLALRPDEAVSVVLGAPAPGEGLVPANALSRGDGSLAFDLVDAGGRPQQRVRFDGAGQLREFAVLAGDGSARWQARFDAYQAVGDAMLPHSIAIDDAAHAVHAEIELRDLELNPPLPDDIFRLRPPSQLGRLGEGG